MFSFFVSFCVCEGKGTLKHQKVVRSHNFFNVVLKEEKFNNIKSH
jgi:hypothetical protein